MTELLLKLFVKGYPDTDNIDTRNAIGTLSGIVGIICNFILFSGKLIAGLTVKSVAIVADSFNNLSDISSSLVTLFGFRLAQRPADEGHPYGHARLEYLSGIVIAGFIFVIGIELAKSSFDKILHPQPVDFSIVTILILACSIMIKLWMSIFFKALGKKINSKPLIATGVDSRNDTISTIAILIGAIIGRYTRLNIDGYMGVGVSAFILYSSYSIAKETASPLLGEKADRELMEKISNIILSNDKVLGIHDLLIHDYGPGKCYASVHAEVDANDDLLACHDVMDQIENAVLKETNVNLVIHYDPVPIDDNEWNSMRAMVECIVKSINPELSIHDFRIIRGEQSQMVFDLAVPYAMTDLQLEIKENIDDAILKAGKQYTTVIRFDGK